MRCLPVAKVAAVWSNPKAPITHVKCIWHHGEDEDVIRKWLWWKLAKSEKRSLIFAFCRYKVTPSVLCFSSLTFHFPSVQLQSICAKSFRKRQLEGGNYLFYFILTSLSSSLAEPLPCWNYVYQKITGVLNWQHIETSNTNLN